MTIKYDIETRPNPNVDPADFAKPFAEYDDSGIIFGPRDRIKPEEKRAKHLADYNAKKAAHDAGLRDRMALSPTTGQVLCIAFQIDDRSIEIIEGTEKEVLKEFWKLHDLQRESTEFVNFTGRNDKSNFDVNFLYRRSWALSLEIPWVEHKQWVDVAPMFLRYDDWNSGIKLERAALSLGIPVLDTAPITGANFWEHFNGADETLAALAKSYVTQDVRLLTEIYERITK